MFSSKSSTATSTVMRLRSYDTAWTVWKSRQPEKPWAAKTSHLASVSGISPSLIPPCSLLLLVLLERSEHILTQTQGVVFVWECVQIFESLQHLFPISFAFVSEIPLTTAMSAIQHNHTTAVEVLTLLQNMFFQRKLPLVFQLYFICNVWACSAHASVCKLSSKIYLYPQNAYTHSFWL